MIHGFVITPFAFKLKTPNFVARMRSEIAKANLFDDNLIELTFLRENITLDVHEVMEGWKMANELSPNKKAAVLLKTGKLTLLEKEAREYVMNEFKTWPAVAVVVNNLGQRIMGQFVINLTGKGKQIKLFDCEEKARLWLSEILRKN